MSCLLKLLLLPVAVVRRLLMLWRKKKLATGTAPSWGVPLPSIYEQGGDEEAPIEFVPPPGAGSLLLVDNGSFSGDPFPTLSYQWQKKIDEVWTDIDGETNNDYRVQRPNYGEFRCAVTITNTAGTATEYSNTATSIVP